MVTRLALKHGTILEKHENEIFEQLIMLHGIPKAKWSMLRTMSIAGLRKFIFEVLLSWSKSIYIVAAYNSELVWGNKLPKTKKEPWWNRWLERKLKEFNQDLDFINILLKQRNKKKKYKNRLERK